jgi:hypothetical protein
MNVCCCCFLIISYFILTFCLSRYHCTPYMQPAFMPECGPPLPLQWTLKLRPSKMWSCVCVYFSGLGYNSGGVSRIRRVHGKVTGKWAHGKGFGHQSLLRGCTVPVLAWRNRKGKRMTLVQPEIWTELSEYKSRTLTLHQPVCSFVDKMTMFRSNLLLPYSKYLKTAKPQFLIRILCSWYVRTSHIVG